VTLFAPFLGVVEICKVVIATEQASWTV